MRGLVDASGLKDVRDSRLDVSCTSIQARAFSLHVGLGCVVV